MKKCEYWTTKDGTKIKIQDLTNDHLINIIKFLRRYASKKLDEEIDTGYSVLASLGGEMAQFFCEQDLDRLESMTVDDYLSNSFPPYDALLEESFKRKLKLVQT